MSVAVAGFAQDVRVDDDDLLRSVRQALAEAGDPFPVTGVRRDRSPRSSSYRTEILTIRRRGAADVRLFLKDFGTCTHEKDDMAGRRRRELRVYRDLLVGAGLGTPAYLGAVWDEGRDRFWLLLECVDARPLGDFRFARWLGRLQRHVADRDLAACDFLGDHDVRFFASTAESAMRAVAAFSARLASRLDVAVRGYDGRIAQMAAEPATLVHGVYRPYNVLAAPAPGAWRICPTDWEESARGSPLYDLACLSDGFDLARLHVLIDGYEHALSGCVPGRPREEVLRTLAALQVHRNLWTLTKAQARGFSPEGVERLVGRVETIAGRMR